MFKVWAGLDGYVALPVKDVSPGSKGPKNQKSAWHEQMFKWPEEKAKINQWVQDNYKKGMNQYWCPSVFSKPQRKKEYIDTFQCLYADLDDVKPDVNKELDPTMAWESSPNRFAGVWMLDKPVTPGEGELLNKRLSYHLGADKGGWDLTQVLRIPGSKNYKYEGNPKGKLLWYKDPVSFSFIDNKVAPLPEIEKTEVGDFEFFESDNNKLLGYVRKYLAKLDKKTMDLIFATEEEVALADRSSKLWEMECRLVDQHIPRADIISIVACSHWNKYRNRHDEAIRITSEVDKAIIHVGIVPEQEKSSRARTLVSYAELLGKTTIKPGWMIENVWQQASHGIIAGEPKTYKSVIATDIGISVASGQPFLGQFPVEHSGPVIYVQEENADWVVKDRIQKIAASKNLMDGKANVKGNVLNFRPPTELPFYMINKGGINLSDKEDRDYIMQLSQQVKPVLFIFDPLYLMLGEADENSSKDLRPILQWLLQAGADFKASIMVLHHWNKHGKSARGGQRMLGSTLLHGWVESAIYASVVDEQKHIIKFDREFRSFEKPQNLEVQFKMGEPGDTFYEAKVSNAIRNDSDAVYEVIKLSGRITENEIKESLSLTTKLVQQRLKKLYAEGKISKIGDLWQQSE